MNIIKRISTKRRKTKILYRDIGLPERLIQILLKNKKYRTTQDNQYLIQNYEHFSSFQKILKNYKEGELMLESIFKKLDLVLYEPGKVIYSSNDIISSMFYILYGSVKIIRNVLTSLASPKRKRFSPKKSPKKMHDKSKNYKSNDLDTIKEEEKKNSIMKLGFCKKIMKAMKKKRETEVIKKPNINDIDLSEYEAIISKGDEYGFDEINSFRRKNTAKANSLCIIGFLSKEDYKYIFEKTEIIKKNDILKFLEGLQIFKNRNNDKIINNMYNCLKERHINVGETLVEYGEEIKNFYIIRKGFFQVEIKMKETIKNEFNDINSFGNYNDKEKTENIKYEAKNYYTNEQIFKLITYGKGEFLGDIEFYLESKKYLTKIICKSNSSLVYEISYDDFINYMTLGLKKTLIKEAKEKLEYYRKRVKDIRILKSNKINNRNKYKQIILNKLEEEKGEIFKEMENKNNGLYIYEQKHRKRLKTSSFNANINRNIFSINDNLIKGKYNNYMNKIKEIRNKKQNDYLSIYNQPNEYKSPTSIKKSHKKIRLFLNNDNKNQDSPIKVFNLKYNTPLSASYKDKVLQTLPIKRGFSNSIKIKDVYMNNIEIQNKIKNSGFNNIFTNTIEDGFSSNRDIMRNILSKKFIPKTPNDKILKAYSYLFAKDSSNKNYFKRFDTFNRINNYNTQDYSFLRTNDKSSNDSNSNINNILTLKTVENKVTNLKKTVPLLNEILGNKKELTLKEFNLKKYKNFNINYNNFS